MDGIGFEAASAITKRREELEREQLKKLKKILKYVVGNNRLYKKKFKEVGFNPTNISSLRDIEKLFFTTKEELRENHPIGFSCVSRKEISRIQMSGGVTGDPVIIPYTRNDVEQWKAMMIRDFKLAGVGEEDIVQITPAFGLWNDGFGFHFASDALNCFTIPIGPGNTRNQIKFMKDFETTVFCSTASYPLRVAEVAEQEDVDLRKLPVKKLIIGAEPFSDEMRMRIEDKFGARVYDIPGLTEMGGVGSVGFECPQRKGLHLWEDHYLVEIVNSKTGEVLDEGEEGELVYTSLTTEAMPLIRYRSGEISKLISKEKCECGITHILVDRIKGRTDDMIIYKGVKFYPSEVENILFNHGIEQYRIEVGNRDRIKVVVESRDKAKDRDNIEVKIRDDVKEFLGFIPEIEVKPPKALKRYDGKTPRVVWL